MASTEFFQVRSVPALLEQSLALEPGGNYTLENLSKYPVYYYSVESDDPASLDVSEVLEYGKLLPPRSTTAKTNKPTIPLSVREGVYTWVWVRQHTPTVRIAIDLN